MDEKKVKAEIQQLIDKFEKLRTNEKLYKNYNEENTKKNFILPLFRALGWNVESDDVKAEEKVSKKRVDYAFKINGVPKFYLECKPFREFISETKYAKQAIEYAWNKSVTWAILCNFEGIRVFNAEWKWNDKQPTRNQFLDLRYNDYLNSSFKYLIWLSRESFEQGILDKQATIFGKKPKKLPIGEQLFADFTNYRALLTKDILKNNPKMDLSQDVLDEIVQRILDRIIFIRTCEDKEIESDKLESLIRIYSDKEWKIYKELNKKFRNYDDGYNSKLFVEHECEKVIVSNDILNQIISGTYRSKNLDIRYDFSAIDADVLGNIYEQYLGHILKSTSKRAKIKNGKAHRKEHGIYYTPTYIVDYITRNTVGEQLKKRKINIDEIKIIDPACGSGSFLIKAFDVLSEYLIKKEGRVQQAKFEDISEGKLLKRKTELIKNCIFGVDIDVQAVEISQLNLLLKIAEKRHRLPTLQENIKIGDSLIDNKNISNRAFIWEKEFDYIFKKDGFDIVIGNPPYVQKSFQVNEDEKIYLIEKYGSSMGRLNTFGFFIKLGIDLLKDNGRLGFIIPNTILTQDYYEELRNMILDTCMIESIVSFANLPFRDAIVENIIIILKKEKNKRLRDSNKIKIINVNPQFKFEFDKELKQNVFYKTYKKSFNINLKVRDLTLQERLKNNSIPLGDLVNINQAIALKHDRAKYIFKEQINLNYKPLLDGRDINRYFINFSGNYLKYDINAIHSCKRQDIFLANEKLLFRRVGRTLVATYDSKQFYALNTLVVITTKKSDINLKFILGLLNSKLFNYYYTTFLKSTKKVFSEIHARQIEELPIKIIPEVKRQPLIDLVNEILLLHKKMEQLKNIKTNERIITENKIKKIDNEIDKFVYKLYDLTKEEIFIVEKSLEN